MEGWEPSIVMLQKLGTERPAANTETQTEALFPVKNKNGLLILTGTMQCHGQSLQVR